MGRIENVHAGDRVFSWLASAAIVLAAVAAVRLGLPTEAGLTFLALAVLAALVAKRRRSVRAADRPQGPWAELPPDDAFDAADYELASERRQSVEDELREMAGRGRPAPPLGALAAIGFLLLVLVCVVASKLGLSPVQASDLALLADGLPLGLMEGVGVAAFLVLQALLVFEDSDRREDVERLRARVIEEEVQAELRAVQGERYRPPGGPTVAEILDDYEPR
ncbi:MAG: hypothetical protein AAGF23_25865 [Acidobacteriota bacterium]